MEPLEEIGEHLEGLGYKSYGRQTGLLSHGEFLWSKKIFEERSILVTYHPGGSLTSNMCATIEMNICHPLDEMDSDGPWIKTLIYSIDTVKDVEKCEKVLLLPKFDH
jgi:hypothetical protein